MREGLDGQISAALRLEQEATRVPPLSWADLQDRARHQDRLARRRFWAWLLALGIVTATTVPAAADAPLQQAVLRTLGSRWEDPGLYAAATHSNWRAVHLVSAVGGYALTCSGYYDDGYETAVLCAFRVPAAVAQAHAAYGPFLPALQLTDAAGRTVNAVRAEGGPGGGMVYVFHGLLRPGQATLRVRGLPTAPAGVPAARQPHFPPMGFQLEPTTGTRAVVVRNAGSVSRHGIRVSVAEFVSSPGVTHVAVRWAVTAGAAGWAITGAPPASGAPQILLRPDGALPLGLALRSAATGTLRGLGGSSGPDGASADFFAAPHVGRFTVEVPSVQIRLASGATQVIRGPWAIPVRLPK